MKTEFELNLQAYLDGELPPHEARSVEDQCQTITEAKALLTELQSTRAALRGNEPEYKLPETREFYWNKIERAILAEEKSAERPTGWFRLRWSLRYWPQLSGATLATALLLFTAVQFHWFSASPWDDMESSIEETGTFTFRSEEQRMTLVWVSNPTTTEEEEESESIN